MAIGQNTHPYFQQLILHNFSWQNELYTVVRVTQDPWEILGGYDSSQFELLDANHITFLIVP